jgi:hypothetical protein
LKLDLADVNVLRLACPRGTDAAVSHHPPPSSRTLGLPPPSLPSGEGGHAPARVLADQGAGGGWGAASEEQRQVFIFVIERSCMYVYVHIQLYICTYTYVCICMYVSVYVCSVCVYVCMYACMYVYIHTHIYAYINTYVYVCVCKSIHTQIYVHTGREVCCKGACGATCTSFPSLASHPPSLSRSLLLFPVRMYMYACICMHVCVCVYIVCHLHVYVCMCVCVLYATLFVQGLIMNYYYEISQQTMERLGVAIAPRPKLDSIN